MRGLLIILLFFPFLINAQIFPAKPSNYVTDEADVLTTNQEQLLNEKLKEFEKSTTNQLFIYTASSLNESNIDDLCKVIFNTWRIGQKDKNNGILVAVFVDDRKMRIQVGFGLEKMLRNDLTLRIQEREMRPLFKEREFYEGLDAGVDKLIYFSGHEETYLDKVPWKMVLFFYVFNAVIMVILYFVCRTLKARPTAAKVIMTIGSVLFIIPLVGAFASFILIIIAAFMSKGTVGGQGYVTDYDNNTIYHSSGYESSYSSSSSDSSDFDGGGGGSSDSGGSSSDW